MEPDKARAAKIQPSGVRPQQDRALAGPPPRPRRPPGRPEARKRGGIGSRRPPGSLAPPDGREERVAGRREQRVSLLPQGIAELDPTIRWLVEERLRIIEEVVCGPQDAGTSAPGMEEMEGATLADDMRAELRVWWQEFPEPHLLTELYQRATRRREGGGSPDSRRPPSHPEGLRVARGLLVDIPDAGRLDAERYVGPQCHETPRTAHARLYPLWIQHPS